MFIKHFSFLVENMSADYGKKPFKSDVWRVISCNEGLKDLVGRAGDFNNFYDLFEEYFFSKRVKNDFILNKTWEDYGGFALHYPYNNGRGGRGSEEIMLDFSLSYSFGNGQGERFWSLLEGDVERVLSAYVAERESRFWQNKVKRKAELFVNLVSKKLPNNLSTLLNVDF
jgi:hypothetical protein